MQAAVALATSEDAALRRRTDRGQRVGEQYDGAEHRTHSPECNADALRASDSAAERGAPSNAPGWWSVAMGTSTCISSEADRRWGTHDEMMPIRGVAATHGATTMSLLLFSCKVDG
ncbi:hypothetical protein AB1Y20_016085 [Prymnesium parvum]|uniref:Uncharacterized protein n=1 Tax=Prymnesium parvum TaxID=97485 RepID=A0AB34K2R1_PRYPA